MLTEAHIEIVDAEGHVEDRVQILDAGEIGLSTRGTCGFRLKDDPDVDVTIRLRDRMVVIEAKTPGALRINGEFIPIAGIVYVQKQLEAFIATLQSRLRIRTVSLQNSSLMSSGAVVIRTPPSPLEAWATSAATRGERKVGEHLSRLRAAGSIDETGTLLVPFPDDMKPGSKSDV